MIIRNMQPDDRKEVVNLHLLTFPGFFLTFMGPAFLSLLYGATMADPSGIAIVAVNDNGVAGFVTGTTHPSGFYKRLQKQHLFGFFWASMGAFLKNPGILPRLFRAFSMTGQPLPADNCATLMSIAVTPDFQGQGVGGRLVDEFLKEARTRGAQYVSLTTDAVGNDMVNQFYLRRNFVLFRKFTTPEGRLINEYLFKLS